MTSAATAVRTGPNNPAAALQSNLDLALIGNCSYGALVDKHACVKWCCLPRLDGDPIFCSLLRRANDIGFFEISVENFSHSKQYYIKNTAVLRTEIYNKNGEGIEVTDFAPRFMMYGRAYRPIMMIRMVRLISGHPRIRVRIRPTFGYGWGSPEKTRGTNHIRYLLPNFSLRVTTNAPISYVVDEILFELQEPLNFVLMPDESLKEALPELVATYLDKTINYWIDYSRHLSIPFEWQEQVIRACITLKMCSFEETGALIASITTSVPVDSSHPGYDLRFCWLRDSSNIIHTLNKLGATQMMEDFLKYISNLVAGSQEHGGHLQPVYGIALETALPEKEMHRLAGYRGMGPVRVGTRDYSIVQHDVYGQVILAITQMFFDQRLKNPGDKLLFERLEGIGELAVKNFDQPDAGPLGINHASPLVHTFSSVMCWASADRLKKIAKYLGLKDRVEYWAKHAESIHTVIEANSWNESLQSFTDSWGGEHVDAFLLLLPELGFLPVSDKRYISTVDRVEKVLRKGKFLRCASQRMLERTDNCSTTVTLWFINALAGIGRRAEAREMYEHMLSVCNSCGLLSEMVNPETGELWGNFPKTTAMVGLIEAALRLSSSWEEVI